MSAHKLFEIQGRKAMVTGSTRGLGYGMAEGLLEAGCEVCIVGTSEKALMVAQDFANKGYKAYGCVADLRNREGCLQCFDKCLELLGGDLDILAICHGIQRRHSAEIFPDEEWDEVIDVNLNSVFTLCKSAGSVMLKKGYGKIITVTSMCSFFGGQIIPAYAAAKGGVMQLTKALSNDWLARGINVNSIAPGYMATDLNVALLDPSNPRYAEITNRIPAHRWGTGEDMKGATIFLASHASDYLGGVIIPVDGGYLVK